ncbi:MAG: hypothetical protein QOK25_461, partial [Thermoleophilaceae bacterium]|nr:hypothetical protein [Thermoleophilaceae bacterium]
MDVCRLGARYSFTSATIAPN